MRIFNSIITKHFRLSKLFFKINRPYCMYDRNFNYFRNKDGYKKSVIKLNNDFKENRLAGPGISFLVKEQNVQIDEFFSHLITRENVMKLTMSQLKDTMYLMANERIDIVKYENILKHIDEKCAINVDRWNLDFCLYILDAWHIILGSKAFRTHYYNALTNLLNKKTKKCSKNNLMLILYFIGMSKRSPPFFMQLLEHKMENFISDLSDEEWAIACLSFFKTSTKINSDLLLKKCCKAAENILLKKDRFNLICILKCLRLSRYFDANLLRMVDEYIKSDYASFNFVECTNFLAYFATQNVYSFETYNCLERQGIFLLSKEDSVEKFDKHAEKMHPSERSRVKDLARFLWGMAFVGHRIDSNSINFIIEVLNIRLSSTEFESNLPALIDCLQSLILFGYYPSNMIEYVLSPPVVQKISNINKAKPKYQLYFVNKSVYLEKSVTVMKNMRFLSNIPKSLQNDISLRKGFKELIQYLNIYLKDNSFMCCYIMPHIMISGIVVATNPNKNKHHKLIASTTVKLIENEVISKCIQRILDKGKVYTCIELLDPSVCVHGSNMPLGLMKTKIRQLEKLNIDVITLTPEEIRTLTKSSEKGQCSKLHSLINVFNISEV